MTTKKKLGTLSFYVVAILLAVIALIPFLWMVSTSFKSRGALMSIPILLQAFYHPYFCLIFRIFGITIIKKTTLEKVSINFNSTILVRRKRVCIGLSNSRIFHQNNAGGLCR